MFEEGDFLCLKSDPEEIIGVYGGSVGEEVVVLTTFTRGFPTDRTPLWEMKHKDDVQKYRKPST